MRPQTYRTRANGPDKHDLIARACGVRKIVESGLPSEHPLTGFAITFINGMPSPGSTRVYGYNIGDWFRWCLARGLDPSVAKRLDGRAFLADLHGRAPTTRVQVLASLRSFYEEAIYEELAERNPFRGVKSPSNEPITPTPALTLRQFEHLLTMIRTDFGHADRDRCARRDFAMVYLMGRLGLRREETRKLHWGDLHGTGDAVTLTVHGKGDKYADVHVPHDVQEVLQSWREALAIAVGHVPGPRAPIFPVLGGAHRHAKERTLPLSVFSVGAIVRRRMIDAGFDGPRYGAHALRATAATVAHENGADLLAISRLLRHANPKTTERYIKTSENRRTSAAETWRGPVFAVV